MDELILYVYYTAKPGCREQFLRDIGRRGILCVSRNAEGCLAYDYYFSAQDENVILLVEKWASAAHQRVHMEQPHMAELKAIKKQFVDDTRVGRVHPD